MILLSARTVSGDTAVLSRFVPAPLLRRLDPVTREALLALCLILEEQPEEGTTGLILVSEEGPVELSRRFLSDILASGEEFASPTHFSASVHNALAGQISLLRKITGPVRTISAGRESLPVAAAAAESWLADGRAERVVILAADENSPLLALMDPRRGDVPCGALAWLAVPDSGIPGRGLCRITVAAASETEDPEPAASPLTALGLFLDLQERLPGRSGDPVMVRGAGLQLTLLPA